jgi:hypothetical protein
VPGPYKLEDEIQPASDVVTADREIAGAGNGMTGKAILLEPTPIQAKVTISGELSVIFRNGNGDEIVALLSGAIPVLASTPGTLHEKAIIADSPEHLKQANDLFQDGDEESFIQMMRKHEVVVCARQIAIQIDDVNPLGGWIKIHMRGHGDVPMYAQLEDIDIQRP